jgi:hypothetical protein
MAIKRKDLSGIIVGHTVRFFPQRKTSVTLVRDTVTKPYLGGYIQVWTENKIVFIQCPKNTACILIPEGRTPTIEEAREVMRAISNAYPIDTAITILEQERVGHNNKEEPFYTLKFNPQINRPHIKPPQRQKTQAQPAMVDLPADASAPEAQDPVS